ncbi:MAG TPA: DUF6702 family protein [Flavobacterium sp.]|jgi:hypothetical protein
MNNLKRIFLLTAILTLLCSVSVHKFYVAIHQVNYASDKKMLQITSRIFIDDLNDALQQKYHKKFYIGEKRETQEQVVLMQQYLIENFGIKVNGKSRPLNYRSKEIDNNVVLCYFSISDISKITNLQITNKILCDLVTEQQNIIQTNVNGQKKSLLLTADNPHGELSY